MRARTGLRHGPVALLAGLAFALAACDADLPRGDRSSGGAEGQTLGATSAQQGPCRRPYSGSSPWNTPIPRGAAVDPRTPTYRTALGERLSSDPGQYTYPVYEATRDTPRVKVRFSGFFSRVSDGNRTLRFLKRPTLEVPIPRGAEAAEGSDAQIIIIDRSTGHEWGLWRARSDGRGRWHAQNGYRYNVRWDGVPPLTEDGNPFGSRGAGVPYLAGLVRACELARGRIDHALAFAYDYPSSEHVFPATKSDGKGRAGTDLPEGSRLQLDPALSRRQIEAWGCTGHCLVIARALQRYGMYVIDNSGRAKVMLEYEGTANWGGAVDSDTVKPIPMSAFWVIEPCTIVGTQGADRLRGTRGRDVICARAGDDRVRAGPGNDVVYGGWGNDFLDGGRGRDKLFGERGRDRIVRRR